MSQGLLINYAGYPYAISSFFPDNGLASLAGQLLKNNHSVKILDFSTISTVSHLICKELSQKLIKTFPKDLSMEFIQNNRDLFFQLDKLLVLLEEKYVNEITFEVKNRISKDGINWIGFKLWAGSGFQNSLKIAKKIKEEFPNIKIFGGGPQVDIFKELIFKRTESFDSLTFGEGENAIVELAEYVDGKRDMCEVTNQIFNLNGKICFTDFKRVENLDGITYPVYDSDIYIGIENSNKMKLFCLDDSRGCPVGCAFCCDSNRKGRKRYEKNSYRLFSEMKYIKGRYKSSIFRFSGSNTPIELLTKLSREILTHNEKFSYSAFTTAVGLNKENAKLIKNSGLFGLFMGVESGDSGILSRGLGKKINLQTINNAIDCCKDQNIFISCSIIYPAPFENEKSTQNTLEFLIRNLKGYTNSSVPLNPSGLYPNTIWADKYRDYNFELLVDSMDEYALRAMNYNFKEMMPKLLWDDLPYKLNGKYFKELLVETSKFGTKLENDGIKTMITDDIALVSKVLKCDFGEFYDRSSSALFAGNIVELRNIIENFNDNCLIN